MNDTFKWGIVFICLFIVCLVFGASLYFKKAEVKKRVCADREYDEDEKGIIEEKNTVRVVHKTLEINEQQQVESRKIMFETRDGERLYLRIQDHDIYEKIIVGDIGTLRHSGKQFVSFK